jgi:hypothetical protein
MIDASFWISNALSFVLGLIGSVTVWWIFSHGIVPKIKCDDFISKIKTSESQSGIKYRIGFRNVGRRKIVDVELFVRLGIKGLDSKLPDNYFYFTVPTGYNRMPKMEPRKSCHRHITRLDVHLIDELADSHFSAIICQLFEDDPKIRQALRTAGIDAKDFARNSHLLEHIMSLGTEATLEAFVFGYDQFSGARKLFGPTTYKITNVKSRKFTKLPS